MGGIGKAVGGALGGANEGIKGSNQGPSEGTIRATQVYPDLRDPVYRSIQDARRLYEQGYSVPRINRRQQEGIENIEDWSQLFGGQLGKATGNVANIAAGNRAGDAPGDDYFRSMLQPQGDSSSQNFFESIYGQGGTPKEGWDTLRQAADLADDGSRGLEWLQDTAGGKFLGANPYLDNVIGAMNRGTTDAYGNAIAGMEGSMSRAGGMGGSMEALLRGRENEGLTRGLAENEAKIRYGDYASERGYQEQARHALPGALATETGAMTAAGGALNNAAYQRLAAQMAAAQQAQGGDQFQQQQRMAAAQQLGQGYRSDIQQQLAAAGQLPGLGSSGFNVGNQLLGAGEYTRSNLERQNNAGWEGLQQYLGLLGGVKGLFGTGAMGAQQPPSANAQAWGNAMKVAGLFMPGGGMGQGGDGLMPADMLGGGGIDWGKLVQAGAQMGQPIPGGKATLAQMQQNAQAQRENEMWELLKKKLEQQRLMSGQISGDMSQQNLLSGAPPMGGGF